MKGGVGIRVEEGKLRTETGPIPSKKTPPKASSHSPEDAGLEDQAVPVPQTANDTIRNLPASSMSLNLTVHT